MANQDHDQRTALARLNQDYDGAELGVAVEVRDGEMNLSGLVDSDEDRQAAIDLAQPYADDLGLRVNDGLEVETFGPEDAFDPDNDRNPPGFGDLDVTGVTEGRDQIEREGSDVNSGYVDLGDQDEQPIDADFASDPGTTDVIEAVQEGVTYFPPTDPPTTDASGANFAVLNGFAETSDDTAAAEADEPEDDTNRLPVDDELADIVRRELDEDALTTDLPVHVLARGGTVILRGEVDTLEDAENAEAVANRIPAVVEVREELSIRGVSERDQ